MSIKDAGREFHVDGAAVLKACLQNDVLLNGVCSSGVNMFCLANNYYY